jgi:protoporphyrinogen oxidase
MSNKKRVAIIGGGPMGLAVAYELSKKTDVEVDVFEAGDRLGGMSVSFDFDGLNIERYYHFICKPDTPLFEALEELGIKDKLKWTETRMGYYFKGELHEWGNPFALLKFPHIDLVTKIRYGLMAFVSTKRNDWSGLDKIDAVTWIKKWIGQKGYDALWKSLFELKFYEYTPNLSAAWIWTRIKRVGNSRKSLLQEELGYLEGGSETVLNALADSARAKGVNITLSQPIREVILQDGRVQGIRFDDHTRDYDAVISTAPLPLVPQFVPDLPESLKAKFDTVDNIAVVCIIVKLKKAVSPYFWLNIVDDRMDIPGIVEYSNLNPLPEHIVYIPYYVPGENPLYSEPDEAFEEKAKRYLKYINPDLSDDDFLGIEVSRYRRAQPICLGYDSSGQAACSRSLCRGYQLLLSGRQRDIGKHSDRT